MNQELKFFDRDLYAEKSDTGLVQIFRKGVRWETFDLGSFLLHHSRPNPHYVISLTDNWSMRGKPVEWGIEPLLTRLREIDNHNRDVLGTLHEENAKRQELKKRAHANERKARAYDMRRDFARAFNEVNTSTLEKLDSRRKKDAHCK